MTRFSYWLHYRITERMSKPFPAISEDLLKELERIFCVPISTSVHVSLDDFRQYQGKREVVEFLRKRFEDQQNPPKKPE